MPEGNPDPAARQQLLSDLFHGLSQPLTSLRCLLEVALLSPRTEQQYRETVQAALQQAERISSLFTAIHEMLELEEAGKQQRGKVPGETK